ncbi:hypothetical protein HK096_010973 [Nowakowskiella sp. JEL0078]|nr:hypothetical protein HK096_010973 [Nowakowskiella sp. JEL0078]
MDLNRRRRRSFALFLSTRTLYYSAVRLIQLRLTADNKSTVVAIQTKKSTLFGNLTKSTAQFLKEYGALLTFGLNVTHISLTLLLFPQLLPASYYHSIIVGSGNKKLLGSYSQGVHDALNFLALEFCKSASKHPWTDIPVSMPTRKFIGETVDRMIDEIPVVHSSVPKEMLNRRIASFYDMSLNHTKLLCALYHPTCESCIGGSAVALWGGFTQGLRFYIPINLALLTYRILVKYWITTNKKSDTQTEDDNTMASKRRFSLLQIFYNTFGSTVRSSLFVGSIISVQMFTLCTLRRYLLAGLVSTPLGFLERPQRLIELNIYCLAQVFESIWRLGLKEKWWKSIRNGEMVYLPIVLGTLVYLHQTSDVVAGIYKTTLDSFIGPRKQIGLEAEDHRKKSS